LNYKLPRLSAKIESKTAEELDEAEEYAVNKPERPNVADAWN